MSIIHQLASNNFITVNKTLAREIGLEESIILGELCAEYEYWKNENRLENDMFYCSVSKLEENTTLSDRKQRRVIKHLEELGIIKTELKGLPATRYFKINEDVLLKFLQIGRTSSCKTQELDVAKCNSSNNINNNKLNNNTISKDIVEKSKSKKLSLYDKCMNCITDFTDDAILQSMLEECLKIFLTNSRESGIPFYTNNFKGKLNKLKSLSTDNYVQRDIVKQTIDNGWNGFYELKKTTRTAGDARTNIERLSTKTVPRLTDEEIKERNRRIENGELEQF